MGHSVLKLTGPEQTSRLMRRYLVIAGAAAAVIAIATIAAAVKRSSTGRDFVAARTETAAELATSASSPAATASAVAVLTTRAQVLALPSTVLSATVTTGNQCGSYLVAERIGLAPTSSVAQAESTALPNGTAAVKTALNDVDPSALTTTSTVRAYPALVTAFILGLGHVTARPMWVVEISHTNFVDPGGKITTKGTPPPARILTSIDYFIDVTIGTSQLYITC
jgi:hypothetical protein